MLFNWIYLRTNHRIGEQVVQCYLFLFLSHASALRAFISLYLCVRLRKSLWFGLLLELKQSTIPQEKQENALGTETSDKDNTTNKLIKTEQNSEIGKHYIELPAPSTMQQSYNRFVWFFLGDSLQKTTDKIVDDKSHNNNSISDELDEREKLSTPIDWKPQENCYFCVDGKLLTVNDKGDLVAESGSVNTEPELANRVCISPNWAHFCG